MEHTDPDDNQKPTTESSTTKAEDDPDAGGGYNSGSIKRAKLQSALAALLEDPILSDLPKNPTLSDVDTLISLELGGAMRISVLKLDSSALDVAVMNTATVKDLKIAVNKKVNDLEQSQMGHRQISWKHVWANFCLSYHNQKLLDDCSRLQDYGIRNNSQVQFIPYVVSKNSGQHSKRRKHCFFHAFALNLPDLAEKHGSTHMGRLIGDQFDCLSRGYSYYEKLVIPPLCLG